VSDTENEEPDAYATVPERATARFGVQGSEFIGHAAPAETTEAAEAFVGEVREAYADATHNVPAYRVRADPFREYASDDGEPSGSAGKPMLSVLQGRGLENVCVVVTRYFGGTELGVGGLASAYSTAAADALDAAGTVERRPRRRFRAVVDYDDVGDGSRDPRERGGVVRGRVRGARQLRGVGPGGGGRSGARSAAKRDRRPDRAVSPGPTGV